MHYSKLMFLSRSRITIRKCVFLQLTFPASCHAVLGSCLALCVCLLVILTDKQVELYADFDYSGLRPFLMQSSTYSIDKAMAICEKRKFYPELVYLLGRVGNTTKALNILVYTMRDVKQVRFAFLHLIP